MLPLIDPCKIQIVIASYLRGNKQPYDPETIAYLSENVIKQAEMLIHSIIREEIERIKSLPQST